MQDHGVTLDINMAPVMDLPRNMLSILKWSNGVLERVIMFELSKCRIFYLEQILENELHLMSWQTLRQSFNIQTLTSPDWFCSLQNFVNRSSYTGNYLGQWMEQKHEDLKQVSEEELDLFINDQPTPIAPSSDTTASPEMEAEEVVEDLAESSNQEEEEGNRT